MQWRLSLPSTDPTPTQTGSSVANFELFTTFWISQAMCDPTSKPFGSCTPVSDSNNPNTAGAAFMELQFYPPGIARSQTSWSVSITIDSAHDNVACGEPVTWANITADGNPNSSPFLMSNGDTILVTIKDTSSGVRVDINDVTANRTGFMVASGANGFVHNTAFNAVQGSCNANHTILCTADSDCPGGQPGACGFCQTEPFDFHPLYSTASPANVVHWAGLQPNIGLSFEIGHWELCANSSCSGLSDGDSDDSFCGPIRGVGGCQGPDLDEDGVSYQSKWPDGTSNHPSSIAIGSPNQVGIGPMSAPTPGSYSQGYDEFRLTTTQSTSAAFYPFYSTAGCTLNFGNDIPGVTTNDFSKASQYTNQLRNNPCSPAPTLVDVVGFGNVDGDAAGLNDVVAVGRTGTPLAGYVFVGLTTSTGVTSWSWVSPARMIDDGGKTWLADVNGDGKVDLITQGAAGGANAGFVAVGLSNGLSFPQWSWVSSGRMVDDNSKTWFADVNGDGKADLVTQGGAGGGAAGWVSVGLSNGTSFPQWSWSSGTRMLDDNSKTWLADVNGDHMADLVTQGEPGGSAAGWVAVGISNGTSFPQWSWVSGGRMLDDGSKTWLADVNGDGKADLITQGEPGGPFAGFVAVGLTDGLGFAQWSSLSSQRVLDDGSKTWLADVNHDGMADLVSQGEPGGVNAGFVSVGISTGSSFPQWSWTSPERRLDDDSNSWVVDLNGDGQADLTTQSAAGYFYTGLSDGLTFGFWSWAF